MELLLKVGNKQDPSHKDFTKYWRDCQLVDIREDGFHTANTVNKCFVLLRTPHDYWKLRGSTNWKSTAASVYELKKFLVPTDSNGKYPWEFGYLEDEKRIRPRDWFVDFKKLMGLGWVDRSTFDSIYDYSVDHKPIYIDRDLTSYLVHEDATERLSSEYSLQRASISSGTHSIGSGLDYDTVTAFEAAIAATLTGDLTGEHNDEETTISSFVTFDTDTATYLLKLTAQSGDEHNGTFGSAVHAAGDGARISFGSGDRFSLEETVDGDLDHAEISKLVLDIAGTGNVGVALSDGGNTNVLLADSLLIKGDSASAYGLRTGQGSGSQTARIQNCIVYGIGDGGNDCGILLDVYGSSTTVEVLCNTLIKNYSNIRMNYFSGSLTRTFKNNIAQQDSGNIDYDDSQSYGWGTTAKNISEDATSPDATYRSKDLHTNSIFKDYANDDYRLDSAGDTTNLAIADDGDNLYGSGVTEDIEGTARDNGTPFWIGASHIAAAGATLSAKRLPYNRYIRNLITR